MNNSMSLQRRKFLQKMALLAGGTALFSQQGKMKLIETALAASGAYADIQDYKSLVCVFLHGGNDGFNMLVPMQTEAYSDYQNLRQTIAIEKNKLLPLNGIPYGLHPAMQGTRDLYNQGRVALISNVGNLVEPLSKQQYLDYIDEIDTSVKVPQALFSHSDQINFWQTSKPTRDILDLERPTGWGGRIADLLAETNTNGNIPLTIALQRQSLWHQAQETIQLTMDDNVGLGKFTHLSNLSNPLEARRSEAWNSILEIQGAHALEQQASGNILQTRHRMTAVREALALSEGQIDTPYSANSQLSRQLRMVARMIYAREQLGIKRQIFFISTTGYDNHGSQIPRHQQLLTDLDSSLNSFNQTMDEFNNKGIATTDSITTFTSSEFGRTLGSNGDGTDHGWGSHQLVMGGAVNGGTIHGELPIIAAGSPDDIGNAILPKYATDQYGATLAQWLGVSDPDLLAIFPNLVNFPVNDLGFMNT